MPGLQIIHQNLSTCGEEETSSYGDCCVLDPLHQRRNTVPTTKQLLNTCNITENIELGCAQRSFYVLIINIGRPITSSYYLLIPTHYNTCITSAHGVSSYAMFIN